jgi:hypothetical protein
MIQNCSRELCKPHCSRAPELRLGEVHEATYSKQSFFRPRFEPRMSQILGEIRPTMPTQIHDGRYQGTTVLYLMISRIFERNWIRPFYEVSCSVCWPPAYSISFLITSRVEQFRSSQAVALCYMFTYARCMGRQTDHCPCGEVGCGGRRLGASSNWFLCAYDASKDVFPVNIAGGLREQDGGSVWDDQ